MTTLPRNLEIRFRSQTGITAAVLALCLGWALLPAPDSNAQPAGFPALPERETVLAAPAILAAVAEPAERLDAPAMFVLEPCDLLTGETLEVDLVLESAGRVLATATGPSIRFAAADRDATEARWRYEAPGVGGPRAMSVPAATATVEDGQLRLPYHAGVRGTVHRTYSGLPVAGAKVLAFLFDPAKLQRLRARFGKLGQMPPEALDSLPFRIEHYEAVFGSVEVLQTVTDADGRFELLVPAGGQVTIHAWHADTTSRTTAVETIAGEWVDWEPAVDARPVVTGIVRGSDGRPLPGLDVQVGTQIELGSSVLSPLDRGQGFGMAQAARSSGHPLNTVAWHTVRTDRKGRYLLRVPQSARYAAAAVSDGSYVFKEVENPGPYQPETVIDLELIAPGAMAPLKVEFANGEPVDHADIQLCLVSDFPWFRQFPRLATDAEGALDIPWREPGARYGLAISHPHIRGVYPHKLPLHAEVITIPAERQLMQGR